MKRINKVAILGAGTMGNGIAHIFARSGYRVILRDVERKFLERGIDTIAKNLDREVKKGKLAEAGSKPRAERCGRSCRASAAAPSVWSARS